MSENYKFFQHKQCEYFPCHEVENTNEFNCLFCYCPLYFVENCGGNNTYLKSVKNCTNCTIPHSENGYSCIIDKIVKINKEKRK